MNQRLRQMLQRKQIGFFDMLLSDWKSGWLGKVVVILMLTVYGTLLAVVIESTL